MGTCGLYHVWTRKQVKAILVLNHILNHLLDNLFDHLLSHNERIGRPEKAIILLSPFSNTVEQAIHPSRKMPMARVQFKHLVGLGVETTKPCSKSVDEVDFSGA